MANAGLGLPAPAERVEAGGEFPPFLDRRFPLGMHVIAKAPARMFEASLEDRYGHAGSEHLAGQLGRRLSYPVLAHSARNDS